MSQLQQGLQTWGDICATEFCDRGKALPPDPHALAFTFSVTVWKGMGTLHCLCFKRNKYLIRKILEKCLCSASGLSLRKAMGWGVSRAQHLWGCVSRTLFWGLRTSQARCTHLDQHTSGSCLPCWGSGSPPGACPSKATGFAVSTVWALQDSPKVLHYEVFMVAWLLISGTGTCHSSEKVLNAT